LLGCNLGLPHQVIEQPKLPNRTSRMRACRVAMWVLYGEFPSKASPEVPSLLDARCTLGVNSHGANGWNTL
jgi:hypothetical protein